MFGLVGVSYGGFVGYRMAAIYPDAVERVALVCAGVCLEEKDLADGLFPVTSVDEAAALLVPRRPDERDMSQGSSSSVPAGSRQGTRLHMTECLNPAKSTLKFHSIDRDEEAGAFSCGWTSTWTTSQKFGACAGEESSYKVHLLGGQG